MPHEIIGELIPPAIELAADLASDHIARKWGWMGCLAMIVGLASIVALVLWWLGAFSGA